MAEVEVRIEHSYDEEWWWNISDQDYCIIKIHHDDCIACLMGIKED